MLNKRIFVSGGAGVIGLEMIPRLLQRGATVLIGDLKSRPAIFPPEVQYRQGDLNHMTEAELRAFSPDMFIHLAATFERSAEMYGFWEDNFQHNVRLSHHLMTIAKDLPSLERVVFASSYLIYDPLLYQFDAPRQEPVALRECDPILPRNLTGMAKLAHEIELRFLDGLRPGLSTVCARIFRGYGRNSRDVISRWIRALLRGDPIRVYRPEGMFDYIYAADSAEGLIRLGESPATGILNLGTGRARHVQEVVDILQQYFPGLSAVEEQSDIPYEASQADTTASEAILEWKPEYTLERAIPEMIAFERANASASIGAGARSVPIGAILITSASRKAPLIRAVQCAARKLDPNIRVIATDIDGNALARHVADDFSIMPPFDDEQLPALVEECRKRRIRVVIPTRDGELAFWARHSQALEANGIHVVVSKPASIERCLDKLAFAVCGIAQGLPCIPAALSPDALAAERYVVKERYGAGSRRIGLNLDREAAIAHARTLEEPIFQPFVAGEEISVDAWLDRRCQVKGLVLRRRDVVVNGESQVTTTFRDVGLEEQATRVLESLEARGPVVLQALIDPQGRLHIIECNLRFGGASTAAIAAGLDPFFWSLLEIQGADLAEYQFYRTPAEVRQVRLPADTYFYGSDL